MSAVIPNGTPVAARHPSSNEWVPARIASYKPYLGRHGYYVTYTLAREQWDCWGGWQPEQCVVAWQPGFVREVSS